MCTYPGLLQPLTITEHASQDICMDFIEALPMSEGKDTILVIIDRLTKYSHFIALTHPFIASSLAEYLL